MRIYLDTNVFISLFKEEIGKNLRAFYLESEEFFSYVASTKTTLVLSELFFQETNKICLFNKERIIKYFKQLEIPLIIIEKEQLGLPVKGIHYPDSIHAGTAIKHNCKAIITFNKKDFESIQNKIQILSPEEFQIN